MGSRSDRSVAEGAALAVDDSVCARSSGCRALHHSRGSTRSRVIRVPPGTHPRPNRRRLGCSFDRARPCGRITLPVEYDHPRPVARPRVSDRGRSARLWALSSDPAGSNSDRVVSTSPRRMQTSPTAACDTTSRRYQAPTGWRWPNPRRASSSSTATRMATTCRFLGATALAGGTAEATDKSRHIAVCQDRRDPAGSGQREGATADDRSGSCGPRSGRTGQVHLGHRLMLPSG